MKISQTKHDAPLLFARMKHDAFDHASCRATLGPLFAQIALLRGYDIRQSTCLKLIPSCPAGCVIGLDNSGLSAPDYFCPQSSERSWRPLTLDASRWKVLLSTEADTQQINKYMKKHRIVYLKCPCFLFRHPYLDIQSQAMFNLHRATVLPLKCGSEDDQHFQSPPGHSRRPVKWCRYLNIPFQHSGKVYKSILNYVMTLSTTGSPTKRQNHPPRTLTCSFKRILYPLFGMHYLIFINDI